MKTIPKKQFNKMKNKLKVTEKNLKLYCEKTCNTPINNCENWKCKLQQAWGSLILLDYYLTHEHFDTKTGNIM